MKSNCKLKRIYVHSVFKLTKVVRAVSIKCPKTALLRLQSQTIERKTKTKNLITFNTKL